MTAPTHALSYWWPWPELILRGEKPWEFRSWRLPAQYVGVPLAVHVAKQVDRLACERYRIAVANRGLVIGALVFGEPQPFMVRDRKVFPTFEGVPLDSTIDKCPGRPVSSSGSVTGNWWAWPVAEYERCEPYPAKGRQGIWRLVVEVAAETEDQQVAFPF